MDERECWRCRRRMYRIPSYPYPIYATAWYPADVPRVMCNTCIFNHRFLTHKPTDCARRAVYTEELAASERMRLSALAAPAACRSV